VKEGYIIYFVVKYTDSFSKAKRKFHEGPRKRFLEEILLWMNILFIGKGMMHMNPNRIIE